MCVGVRVRRSKRGLSHRILVECRVVCVGSQRLSLEVSCIGEGCLD